jgi:hypothetical protein
MSISRRKTLAIMGGGVILAAAGSFGFAASKRPTKAIAPWAQAGYGDDPRRRALSYAILAPNPHNRQPWKVDLRTPNIVTLFVDTNRMLPHTDPFNRQITIGLGCFLEVMRMAALQDGFDVTFKLFPEGSDENKLDQRPVAIAEFVANGTAVKDPLFEKVLQRQSLKEPYDLTKPVANDTLSQIASAAIHGTRAGTTNEAGRVGLLRKLSRDALILEIETPHTYKESVDLFRIGASEVDANPDGIDFSGPLFETLSLAGLFSREAALEKSSSTYQQGLDSVLANTDTAMAHIWLTTAANSRTEQITAGRDWVRVNLAATALGVATQPLSQALQEYPEMKPFYDAAHQNMAPEGGTLQMFARLGYASPVAPSPRWPLDAKIING